MQFVYSLRLAMFFNVLSKPFITSPVFQMLFDKENFVRLDLTLSPGRDDGEHGSNAGRSEWRMQFYYIRYDHGALVIYVSSCCVQHARYVFIDWQRPPPPMPLTPPTTPASTKGRTGEWW